MTERFDAVIVGGGPAGALSALQLARLGWHVALIERGERNRNKTCGHCLNARAIALLRRAGLAARVQAASHGVNQRLRVHALGQVVREFPLGESEGWMVARHELDQLLIDAAADAGAQVFQPAAARQFLFERDRAFVEIADDGIARELSATLIVGADGVGSAVARAVAGGTSAHAGRKFGFALDTATDRAVDMAFDAIEMFLVPNGYVGAIREGNHRIHLAGLIGQRMETARNPIEFVRRAAGFHPALKAMGFDRMQRDDVERFTAIGPMPWRPESCTIAGPHHALVGDAAGYVEPFTGEGMSWALQSAQLLADVASALRPGLWNRRAARDYLQKWKDGIRSGHRACSAIAFGLERHWLSRAGFLMAGALPGLTQRVIRRTVGV